MFVSVDLDMLPGNALVVLASAKKGSVSYDARGEENSRQTVTFKNITVAELAKKIKEENLDAACITAMIF